MDHGFLRLITVTAVLQIIDASKGFCPSDPNCICSGSIAIELNCNINGNAVKINLLPNKLINVRCSSSTGNFDYNKLPKCSSSNDTFQSVAFKDCPLPESSFNDVLTKLGIKKTMGLVFQNSQNISGYFEKYHFSELKGLTKLLLSINEAIHLPDNLFSDLKNITWLNLRSQSINLSEDLFKPLKNLQILEVSHNHMTNISSNWFSHLSLLRKLSLWQSNVTWFSKDFFNGVNVLEELDLSCNELNELPNKIFKPLRKLKKVTLFSNKLSSLPSNLFEDNFELESVIMLNNDVKLNELPKNLFGNLPKLIFIHLQKSGLNQIPNDLFKNSSSITNISLAYNDIETLPEAVFNDQINLLELDLSHNLLKTLEPKLFSSLVKLENLNLCYNSLQVISGSAFSSLLSLIYINMENNQLNVISSDIFSNNKQRMIVSLAYNKLTFESKELNNNKWQMKQYSPFAKTFGLKLLNLSHNEFKLTFEDWWYNGHESLDISHNEISNLLIADNNISSTLKPKVHQISKKNPLKRVWLAHNPLECVCKNIHFIDALEEEKTKVIDKNLILCSMITKEQCYTRFKVFIALIIIIIIAFVITILTIIKYKKNLYISVKQLFHNISRQSNKEKQNLTLKYVVEDEEFVLKEILPRLKCQKSFDINLYSVNSIRDKSNVKKIFTWCAKETSTSLVVFSPNYLTSAYKNVSIKKIRGEMFALKNTVFIYADDGNGNSVYTFLKEQRDRRTTILWGEQDFWNTFLMMLTVRDNMKINGGFSTRFISKNSVFGQSKCISSRNKNELTENFNFRSEIVLNSSV